LSVFWILAVLLFVALLQYLLYRYFGSRRIRYSRRFSKNAVHAGEKLEMIEVIANLKLLPLPWLRVETHMPGSLVFNNAAEDTSIVDDIYHNSVFYMGPYKRITRVHEVTAKKRGHYTIESVSMTTGDVLGLSTTSESREVNMTLSVYPALMDYSALQTDSHRWQGDILMHRFIEPDPFLINGIRPWQVGDSMRDIHWAATARTGELRVKTRDYTASPKMLVLFNVQFAEDQWGERLDDRQAEEMEEALSLCATYISWANANHIDNAFASNGRFGQFENDEIRSSMGWGEAHYTEAMELMARLKFFRRMAFHAYLKELTTPLLRDTDIIILSRYWSATIEEQAQALRRQNNSVLWVPVGGKGAQDEAVS